MNPTFDSMMGAMGFKRVDTSKPCNACRYHGKTTGDVVACFFWNSFKKGFDTCEQWEAKK